MADMSDLHLASVSRARLTQQCSTCRGATRIGSPARRLAPMLASCACCRSRTMPAGQNDQHTSA